jgi:hypothetical protein
MRKILLVDDEKDLHPIIFISGFVMKLRPRTLRVHLKIANFKISLLKKKNCSRRCKTSNKVNLKSRGRPQK